MLYSAFLSHGSPTLLIEDSEYKEVLRELGNYYKSQGVDLVIVSSPHWISKEFLYVHTSLNLPCIQDYYGFPEELYEFRYDVCGDPEFAFGLVEEGRKNLLPVQGTQSWGLDHGGWVILYFMFPQRDISVVPISICPKFSPQVHFEWGKVIRRFSEKTGRKVLFIGSGSTTHRLDIVVWNQKETIKRVFPQGEKFDKMLFDLLENKRYEEILDLPKTESFWEAMPEGFLLPLFITLGFSGENSNPQILFYSGWNWGISMTAIKFE